MADKEIIGKKYLLSRQHKKDLEPYLRQGEAVNFSSSRISKGYCSVETSEKRILFCRLAGQRLEYLYDSHALALRYKTKNYEKSILGEIKQSPHELKLFIAIAIIKELELYDEGHAYLKFFLEHLVKTVARKELADAAKEYSWLFISYLAGLSNFSYIFYKMNMPKEAASLLFEQSKLVPDKTRRASLMGEAYILSDKLREARKCLEKIKNRALYAHKYWYAKGLENWKNRKIAVESFKKAMDCVMDGGTYYYFYHNLLISARREDEIKTSRERIAIIQRLEKAKGRADYGDSTREAEIHAKTFDLEKKLEDMSDQFSEVKSLIKRKPGYGLGGEGVKAKPELEVEKDGYVVFLPRLRGTGAYIDEKTKTEEQVQKKYLENRENYEIFVYRRNVYKKEEIREGNRKKVNMVCLDLDEEVFILLVMFLIYKDKPKFALQLYNKAWEGSPEHKKEAISSVQIMDELKTAISKVRSPFENLTQFDIPRGRGRRDRRGCIYYLRGKLKYCVIIDKSEISKYTLLEDQQAVNDSP